MQTRLRDQKLETLHIESRDQDNGSLRFWALFIISLMSPSRQTFKKKLNWESYRYDFGVLLFGEHSVYVKHRKVAEFSTENFLRAPIVSVPVFAN